jgi:Zn-dependent protease
VSVHPTLALVLVLAVAVGAAQYGTLTGAIFNGIAVLLLFACVLLHEMAHVYVAHRAGILVPDVLLLPIGGVAHMETPLIPPRDEVRIALAGPLMNLAVGACCGVLLTVAAWGQGVSLTRYVLSGLREPSLFSLLAYLAVANLVLGVFNGLPALPLDGGRALRALLTPRLTFEGATRRAAIMGRASGAGLMSMAFGLIGFGMIPYGVTLSIVAFVLYREASHELRAVRSLSALHRHAAGDTTQPPCFTVSPHQPVSVVLDVVLSGQVVPVVVGKHRKLVGLVSSADLRARTGKLGDLSVAHVMHTQFPTVKVDDPLWIAYETLSKWKLVAIPVLDGDDLRGMVTLHGIQHVLRQHAQAQPDPAQPSRT